MLTTVAVFFPIAYVEGIASELFTELALTVSFSLLSSLLVALTLVPMLSSRLLEVNHLHNNRSENTDQRPKGRVARLVSVSERWLKALDEYYRVLLARCLARRARTVIIVVALLIGSLALVPAIGAEFIPSMDQGMINVTVELPHGSSLVETDRVVSQVEQAFSGYEDDIELIFSSIGGSGMMIGMGGTGGGSNTGGIYVSLVPLEERKVSTQEVVEGVRSQVETIPGAEITVEAQDISTSMGMISAPVEVSLKGEDLNELERISAEIADLLRDIPGTWDVTTSLEEGQPEIQLLVDREKAGVYGLSAAQIASAARTAIEGQVATRFRTGSEEIDVRVRLSEGGGKELAEIENLLVDSPLGLMVPLGEVAEIREVQAPTTIQRSDQVRVVSITAQLQGRDLAAVMGEVRQAVEENIFLPHGYTVNYGGEFEMMTESFADLFLALLMAIALVYMVLAAQFESLLHPLVIMFSIPVAAIGVVLALFITRTSFSVVTFIGVIMLAGIVVNNAIVLVDYINQLRGRGLARDEAILTAGPVRLRPILMTALTTILAMLPLTLGLGEGAELQVSMAVAVIGGLTVSTFLTLVFVPVIYSLFDDVSLLSRRRKKAAVKNTIME